MPVDLAPIRFRLTAAAPHLDGCEIAVARKPGSSASWLLVARMAQAAPADLAALCDEVERLREALDGMLRKHAPSMNAWGCLECRNCGGAAPSRAPTRIRHEPSCPWALARDVRRSKDPDHD